MALAYGVEVERFGGMTLADLRALVKARSRRAARDLVMLAWRTAYYQRVKHMPDLTDELAALDPAEGEADEVVAGGYMSEARMNRVWGKIRAGFGAWNARLTAEGGA